jgi:broad specificity phosphatase PhoE
MEITLIRHGKPTFELKGRVRSREISEVLSNYNLSGIADEPPVMARRKALECMVTVCSDFNRSIESAKALGIKNVHLSDPIFREIATPHFNKGSFAMPVSAWVVLLRCLSIVGFRRNGESLSMARQRAKIAASLLIDTAKNYKSVLLVGHGFINYFIAKELLSRGWTGPLKPGSSYWQYGEYTYDTR